MVVKKIILAAVIAVVAANALAVRPALAMPEVSVIRANCRAAQSVLSQLEKAGRGSRVARGRDYNGILDLMFAMNARLASNKIAAPNLSVIAANFEKNLNQFRSDYETYYDRLSQLIETNCSENPSEFYQKLEHVRTFRAKLKADIGNLNQNIQSYYEEFDIVIEGMKL